MLQLSQRCAIASRSERPAGSTLPSMRNTQHMHLCHTGQFPPTRWDNLFFSLNVTGRSLSLSVSRSAPSLSVPQCLSSLWSGGSGALSLALFPGCFLLCETGQSGTSGLIAALSSHPAGFRYISILFLTPLPPPPHLSHIPVIYPLWIRNACLLPSILIYFKQGRITKCRIDFCLSSDISHLYLTLIWPDSPD